jgi:hypothetical protein
MVVDRASLSRSIVGGGAALMLIGTFLPWLSSGARSRSSYELFELVDRLGFSPDGAVGWALRLWPLAPLLLVLSAVAQWAQWSHASLRRARFVLPVLSIVYVGGTATALRFAPDGGLVRLRFGIWVTLIGAFAVGVGLLVGSSARIRSAESAPSAAS